MDLLEYQAKELFHEVGIPILPSQPINDPSELKRLQIPYPIVLKSQVRAGGRGRAGGIRFVENTIDAIAAARAIFNLAILGEYPQVILAEARYNAQQEIFLAVLLDYQLQRPVLMGSSKGGIDVETLLQHLQTVVIEEEFSPFQARRLAIKMGLQGEIIQSLSAIVEKMYCLFLERDLDLVEINPLGVSATGEVMALDGKITINDSALLRQPQIQTWLAAKTVSEETSWETIAISSELRWLPGVDKGNIGILCNSFGLALATWDLLAQDKGKPACCLVAGEDCPPTALPPLLEVALDYLLEIPELKVLLINFLGSPETSQTVAQAIAAYFQPEIAQNPKPTSEERMIRPTAAVSPIRQGRSQSRPHQPDNLPQLVIRLVGGNLESCQESLSKMSVNWAENLAEAINETIALAKSK
jgi:succinyl-CoA synthetase beta subunit